MLESFLVNGSDRFGEVTISFLVLKIDFLGVIILNDPREDRILGEITE